MSDDSDHGPGRREPPEEPPGGDDPLARLLDAVRPEVHEVVTRYGLRPDQTVEVVRSAILAVAADGVPRSLAEGRRRLVRIVESQCRAIWRAEDEDEPEKTS